ncbi:MAG TPA: T9SS type A sorting domain-containing protein, partial [Flavobacteriales bacterium]|nr:T9SS type A sorting domain-containing protein [Flavobacteriales bacterium]
GNGGVGGNCDIDGDNVYADPGDAGNLGGAGGGGRIKIFATDCPGNNIGPSTSYGGGTGNGGNASNGTYNLDQTMSCPDPIDTTDTSTNPNSVNWLDPNMSRLDFLVYPNPAKDLLNITFKHAGFNGEDANVEIFDRLGRVLVSTSMLVEPNESPNLSIEGIANGLYSVRIIVNGVQGTANFVVLK